MGSAIEHHQVAAELQRDGQRGTGQSRRTSLREDLRSTSRVGSGGALTAVDCTPQLLTSPPATAHSAPGFAAAVGQIAHAQDIGLALRHRYQAARVQQVEDMRGLDALVIGWQRQGVAAFAAAGGEQRLTRIA